MYKYSLLFSVPPMYVCFMDDSLRLDNLSGGSSLGKTESPFFISHSLPVTLHLGVVLSEISPMMKSPCQLVLPLCWFCLGKLIVEILWLRPCVF